MLLMGLNYIHIAKLDYNLFWSYFCFRLIVGTNALGASYDFIWFFFYKPIITCWKINKLIFRFLILFHFSNVFSKTSFDRLVSLIHHWYICCWYSYTYYLPVTIFICDRSDTATSIPIAGTATPALRFLPVEKQKLIYVPSLIQLLTHLLLA